MRNGRRARCVEKEIGWGGEDSTISQGSAVLGPQSCASCVTIWPCKRNTTVKAQFGRSESRSHELQHQK